MNDATTNPTSTTMAQRAEEGANEPWIIEFAKRHHRLHHLLWHSVRQTWPTLTERQQKAVTALQWAPPRVAVRYVDRVSAGPEITNGSGQDFLFMHREMIDRYKELGGTGHREWVVVPPPEKGSPPAPWDIPESEAFDRRMRALKDDTHYWSRMLWWDREFKDPTRLRTLTLGELGSLLEYSIHNDMHMRFASQPIDPETGRPLTTGRPPNDISEKWDAPRYDYLGEFYSSHVHPDFWRLHGWVDARIDTWYEAHREAGHDVTRQMVGGVKWFAPGPWVVDGDPWSGGPHHVDLMERVFAVLMGTDAEAGARAEAAPVDPLAATFGAF